LIRRNWFDTAFIGHFDERSQLQFGNLKLRIPRRTAVNANNAGRGDKARGPGFGSESAWERSVGHRKKMAKRQLDPFFQTARASEPKPHAPCIVAATGPSEITVACNDRFALKCYM
jgi:hypothetical protein